MSVQSTLAWDYDSGWIDTDTSTQSVCHGHLNKYGVGNHCGITAGRDPRQYYFASTAYFNSDIYTNLPFAKGDCRVTFRVVYTSGEANEDFIAIINGKSGIVLDPTNSNSVRNVMLPGIYTFYDGWNRVYVYPYTDQIVRWWAQSVWFGNYTGSSFAFSDFQARGETGKDAIRIQCNNAVPPITATLSASPSRSTAPMVSQLRVTASGGNGNVKEYRYRCKSFTGFSSWRTSPTYNCAYPTVGTFTATVQTRQSGNTTVNATTQVVAQPAATPLSVTLAANPSQGYAVLNSWLTATTTGGNSNPREYRYRCKSFTGFSSWRTYNRYSCAYPNPGVYTATVEVRQSGSSAVSTTTIVTVIGPLTATLSASPSRGTAPMNATLTANTTGGNSNRKYYRFKCTSSAGYSAWQTSSNRYTCSYPSAGTQTAKAQVWQSGMSSIYPTTRVTVSSACGNSVIESGEQCDDGNTNNNDGCSSTCQTEIAVCGNGIVQSWGGEQCDDGNNDYTDSCTDCTNAYCGDSYVRSGVEECDDGNTTNGDGCVGTGAGQCTVENLGGACGDAEDEASCSAPDLSLCSAGAPTPPVYGVSQREWQWTCSGVSCSTRKRCGFNEIAP